MLRNFVSVSLFVTTDITALQRTQCLSSNLVEEPIVGRIPNSPAFEGGAFVKEFI